jgi:superfamily II DNA or RNA helicase
MPSMTALHPKAQYWIRQGIFDDLRSFDVFENRVNKIIEEKDRGDAFEIFIEGYLATQMITQCVKHWVVGDIPLSLRERYKLPRDPTGIDGIYEVHDGSKVAYQVKYRQNHRLTFSEVAEFLGITEQFSDRVIFTNAAKLSDKAVTRTRWVNAEAFRALSPEAFKSIEAWLKTKPLPIVKAKPDPSYQVQALADIKAALAKGNRATAVMACGTGKTLVALWAAEQEAPKTVLVLVPSLSLLKQTLLEWSQQTSWGKKFSYLCVCSDPTVKLKDDGLSTDTTEVGFRVDTDPAVVLRFLQRPTNDIKVIFSTYQSSPVVGEGARGLPPFDLAIFDEAHKTIGRGENVLRYAISDENIRIKKRLFLTATPRHIDIRHRDKEGEFRVYSMDDEAIYGPRAHTLSFGKAAEKGIICRYKVIISLIDKKMVDDFTRKQGITLVERDEVGARWMANLIAVRQAIERAEAKKIISFHSRVRLAREFASKEPRGIAYHLIDYDVRHVNGEQSSGDRGEIIDEFAKSQKAVLTNARCLTEGINIPAVDMVAFVDPRHSRIDITQAVGRAMRKPRGPTTKTVGYVVVPVFAGIEEGDDLESAIKSEKFEEVVDVLNSLQEHDDELVDIIREIRQRKGGGEPFNPRRLFEKIEVIGPRVDLHRLTESIGIEIADCIGRNWDEMLGRLIAYKSRQGDCNVTASHSDRRLFRWVVTQRQNYKANRLSTIRTAKLTEIGIIWDVLATWWEEGFAHLTAYKAREGDCRVPPKHIENGFRLGQWVTVQRTQSDEIDAERRRRLEKLGFLWDPHKSKWEAGFAALSRFKPREGHCLVPDAHIENGFRLGSWISNQRVNSDKIDKERRRRLDKVGFVWDAIKNSWEAGFAALSRFKAREGHCRVPSTHVENGFRLGGWVRYQRGNADEIDTGRRRRLDKLGFVWVPHATVWERAFAHLEAYKAHEGHCRVPDRHLEKGFRLGQWVGVQRTGKQTMSAERKRRLNKIGFVWRVKG